MSILFLIILLSNPQISFYASAKGMNLWLNVIIPTLLPFIIISNIILNVYSKHLKNPSIYVILIGLCCGCPMAAISAVNLYQQGLMSKEKCERLIGICNCLSPAFLISFCFIKTLGFSSIPFKFLVATYLPVILLLIPEWKSEKKDNTSSFCDTTINNAAKDRISILENSIINAFLAIIKLGGYIILCSILAEFMKILAKENAILRCLFTGIVEVTTGVNSVGEALIPVNVKLLLCGGMIGFGGICCILQTAGILNQANLSIKKYIYHKIQISLLTTLSYLFVIYVLK